jgi:hypothetical protein
MIKSAKQVLKEFKTILNEAATAFDKSPSEVKFSQFQLISNGRLGMKAIAKYGGFLALRQYVAPSKKIKVESETMKVLERILKNVKAA